MGPALYYIPRYQNTLSKVRHNIRITHAIMRNWTLYKVPKHPKWKETPQHQSNSQNTRCLWKILMESKKEIPKY